MDSLRLHPDTVEAVKQRADILDVVSEHVVLRKRGKDMVGLCPFHDDKSPSFTVSAGKQFYYCFSCGAGGNAIKFLMELGKQSFSEVVLGLAQRYQIPVQTLEPKQREEYQRQLSLREQLYEVVASAAQYFQHALRQPQGAAALAYLKQERGLSEETIQRFQLGYAPGAWAGLYEHLVGQQRYSAELVEQAGLALPRRSGKGFYDRFRDRLMIPIHDPQGRVIGFGGRTLSGEEPKYLNSPETPLFDKGQVLFGLDKARQAIAGFDQAVVVEGYFDVIALHAAGVTNAVAAMGTALSAAQVRQLLRYTESKQIVLNFDADKAGTKAAERAISEVEDLAYQGQLQLRVITLPGGKDADEYLKQAGPEGYRELLNTAPLWLDWQIDRILADRDLEQGDQFQQAIQALVALLGKLPNAPLRSHYIQACAERLGRGVSRQALQLEQDLRSLVKGQRWHGQSRRWEKPGDTSRRELAEAQLLRVYLHCPPFRPMVRQELQRRDLDNFGIQVHRVLWGLVVEIEEAHLGLEGLQAIDRGGGEPELLSEIDLLAILRDQSPDLPLDLLRRMESLLYLSETTAADLRRPTLVVRQAAASLEKLRCDKRCRHLLDSWQRQNIQSLERCIETLLSSDGTTLGDEDPDLAMHLLWEELNGEALQFQRLFDEERRYIDQLTEQIRTTQTDLVAAPVFAPEIA